MQKFYEGLGRVALFAAVVGGSIYLKSESKPKPEFKPFPTINFADSYKPMVIPLTRPTASILSGYQQVESRD